VIRGDQNADPNDGDSTGKPIQFLLFHLLVNTSIAPHCDDGVIDASKPHPRPRG
jgi:hypothetical protein